MLSQTEIWTKYQKTIANKGLDLYIAYFESGVYKRFKIRCSLIDNAIDGKFPAQNAFIADVAPLVIRKHYNSTIAFLAKYFENDPLVTLRSLGATPQQNADIMQETLQSNYTATRFREKSLLPMFDNLARYGTAVAFSQFDDTYFGGGSVTIAAGPESPSPFMAVPREGKKVVLTKSIHPLNYFQDPFGNFQNDTAYKGFLDTWYVSDLFALIDNELYNKENVLEAIKACKNGLKDDYWYGGNEVGNSKVNGNYSETQDHSRATINPIRLWTTLNFDGNEADQTIYYLEFVHRKLIRCHPVDINKDLMPLQTGTYYPRPDIWMGNASLEFQMSYQNLKNWIIGSTIESTMKQMDRMILVRRGGGIDVADINNRHQMSGIVYYDGMDDPSKLMYPVQFQNTANRDIDWLNREINQEIQELSPVVNMQNKYNEGGMNNSTLGAAQMQAGIGETMFGFVMKNVSFFISRIGEVCADILQQNLGDMIPYRPSQMADEISISKQNILGEFLFSAASSYYINEKGERVDSANMITTTLNWQATQNPAFQQLNLVEMLKDWVRAWKGSGTDTAKYLSPQQQQQAQQMPQMPLPGMPPQGVPPAVPIQQLQQTGPAV
jgi:hypothetical protein